MIIIMKELFVSLEEGVLEKVNGRILLNRISLFFLLYLGEFLRLDLLRILCLYYFDHRARGC
jgi:hypothetical protein